MLAVGHTGIVLSMSLQYISVASNVTAAGPAISLKIIAYAQLLKLGVSMK